MKLSLAILFIFLLIIPFVSAQVGYITLPYKMIMAPDHVAGTVNVNFQVNASNGTPIENALIILQGISDQSFSKNLVTNSKGYASISLNQNEIFVYTIYKTSYKPSTGNFFTNSGKTISVALQGIPSDQWYFYYENNGDMSIQMSSSDSSVNYLPGDYVTQTVQVMNTAGSNLLLRSNNGEFIVVDGSNLHQLGWWGNPLYGLSINLTLKPGGWVKVTSTNTSQICVSNADGEYGGQKFDISGSEFVCQDGGSEAVPVPVPNWAPNGTYKLEFNISYSINNQNKNFELLTQGFNIQNSPWHPTVTSSPVTETDVNKLWTYQMTVDTSTITNYNTGFIAYNLTKHPIGMTFNKKTGLFSWTPKVSGNYNVTVRAYHPYFVGDSRMGYTDQNFILDVINPDANLYADKLYAYAIQNRLYVNFNVHNDDDKSNTFPYLINWEDGSSTEYNITNLTAGGQRTIYTYHNYKNPGTYNPELIINPDNTVYENNTQDNIKYFGNVNVN